MDPTIDSTSMDPTPTCGPSIERTLVGHREPVQFCPCMVDDEYHCDMCGDEPCRDLDEWITNRLHFTLPPVLGEDTVCEVSIELNVRDGQKATEENTAWKMIQGEELFWEDERGTKISCKTDISSFHFVQTTNESDIDSFIPHLPSIIRILSRSFSHIEYFEPLETAFRAALRTNGKSLGWKAKRGTRMDQEIFDHFLPKVKELEGKLCRVLYDRLGSDRYASFIAQSLSHAISRYLLLEVPDPPVKDNPHMTRRQKKKV